MLTVFKIQLVAIVVIATALALPFLSVDKELEPYYNEFLDEIKDCPASIKEAAPKRTIMFSNTLEESQEYVGLCHRSIAYIKIEIDRAYWNKLSSDMKYNLFVHEAAHCLLWSDHVGTPMHFMNPSMNLMTKEEVQKQLREEIKRVCGT